jgi:hypothetical protein
MAKAAAKVQAPICKKNYNGHILSVDGFDSLAFTTIDSDVKTK